MTALEKAIRAISERIRSMENNPAPGQLKSDILGAKLDLEEYMAIQDAWKEGKPFLVWQRTSMAKALGFQPLSPPTILQYVPEDIPSFRKKAEAMEMPSYSCDHVLMNNVAYASGEVPMPGMIFTASGGCPVTTYGHKALMEFYPEVPSYTIDYPLIYNEESISYMDQQLQEFVNYAEQNVPGVHYDRDYHLELLEADAKGLEFIRQDWKLRAGKPFPMSVEDGLAGGAMPIHRLPSQCPNIQRSLDYWRIRIDEIHERSEQLKKENAEPESLRVMWVWGPPGYVKVNDLLREKNVVVPSVQVGPTPYYSGRKKGFLDETEFGRKLTPFEEEARMLLGYCWRQCGVEWVDEAISSCRDLECDAIIISQFHDCTSTASLSRLIAERAENELGIPALIIDTKIYDVNVLPPDQYRSMVSEFLDMILETRSFS